MKRIELEIKRYYLYFGFCMAAFIIMNALLIGRYTSRYSAYIRNYREINSIQISYNDSRTYFHLYNKELEKGFLEKYADSMEQSYSTLESIKESVLSDRNCSMMYRIINQMLRHRDEVIEDYISPENGMSVHGIDYIEDLDLLLENNLNLFTSSYLDYVSSTYDDYVKSFRSNMIMLYIALTVGSLILFWVNTFLYESILSSLNALNIAAYEINKRNFDGDDIETGRYEEFNLVISAFNEMKHTIKKMLEEINRSFEIKARLSEQLLENEQQKRYLAEIKMKELQMQINPHFLFNTLSLVIRSIQLNERDNAVTLIKSISKILRSSIETKSFSIPLDEEIELLESYIFIQRIHCKGRINIVLDIKRSYIADEIFVPPLIIQPLVENAIQHGLANVVENGEVKISIIENTGYFEVSVEDNGCGMSEEAIKIFERADITDKRSSIGLTNVIERLRLLYGRDDVIKIKSDSKGTNIRLLFFKDGF